MKQLKRFALTLAALALLAAALFCPAVSAANLDEIEKYFITVRLQPDGSADIDYDIHWKVLDSTTAGPLEWVKVGVPNNNIEPVSHSDTIADLYSYPEALAPQPHGTTSPPPHQTASRLARWHSAHQD